MSSSLVGMTLRGTVVISIGDRAKIRTAIEHATNFLFELRDRNQGAP
jgi:hypothetical protein